MLGNKLKKLREISGYTQQQVADSLNIDRSTYAYYESGKTKPDIEMVMKLAKIFNVSYTDILGNDQNSNYGDGSMSDVSFKKRTFSSSSVYELTKKEQQMIIKYRMLSAEMQDKLSEFILKSLNEDEK